jgi:hypothetical protein
MIAKLRTINRDQARLEAECKVRLRENIPVLNEHNRLKFMLLVEAELHPNSALGVWVKEMIYADPQCFEKMQLTSLATIERDNRELEKVGLFMKEKEQPEVVQQMKL